MLDTIKFLEEVGKDCALRYVDSEQLDHAALAADVDMKEWASIKEQPPLHCLQVIGAQMPYSDEPVGDS